MKPLGDAREHFWRVIKMAKANDVDLSTALDEGGIDLDGYTDMVIRCRSCADVGRCDRALSDGAHLEAVPDYCVNKEVFERLRPD